MYRSSQLSVLQPRRSAQAHYLDAVTIQIQNLAVITQTALLQTKPFTLVTIADQLNVSHTKRRIFFKYAKKVLEENTLLRYPEKQTRYKGERGYWWQPVLINEGVINGSQN